MKAVRQSNLAGLLTVLALILGVITPGAAQADEASGWPLRLVTDMNPQQLVAFGSDSMSVVNCVNLQQATSFRYIYEGMNVSSLAQGSPSTGGVQCTQNQELTTQDGTFYSTYYTPGGAPPYTFAAMKNGRILWQADVSMDPGPCNSAGGSKNAWMTEASQGSNGNIYGIVQSINGNCATYLAEINGVTGAVMFTQQLTTSGSDQGDVRLWVYGDKLLTVDNVGKLRQFDLNGAENTAAAYQFPSTLGYMGGGSAYANADGRVFMVSTTSCNSSTPETFISYHDLNGNTSSGGTGLGCSPNVAFTPGGNGTLVAWSNTTDNNTVKTFSFTSTGVATNTVNLALPSGVARSQIVDFWQDGSNNAVAVRQLYASNWSSVGVTVDRIDGATGTVTNLFYQGVDSAHPSPTMRVGDIEPDGTYLYAMVCHDLSQCPNSASTSIDGWIHKIPLPNFGAPVKDTGSFTTYTSTKLNYVAMGDSYSSGEGVPPYFAGTDESSYDTCHRSAGAYPELIEQNTSLNLNMTGFVACSGAKITDILNNNQTNAEFAQALAIRGRTDVITMSIGGNDADFADTLTTCTLKNAYTDTQTSEGLTQVQVDQQDCAQALDTSASLINTSLVTNLTNTFNDVESLAPTAKMLIVGYPPLYPEYGNITTSCTWGTSPPIPPNGVGTPSGRAVSESEVTTIRSLTSQMNADIQTAVDNTKNSNIMFVDPTAAFAGDELCTNTPWVNGIVFNANISYLNGSYHPNAAGQEAYASVVAAKISTLTFP